MTSVDRILAGLLAATAICGCAAVPADLPATSAEDCAVLMLVGGFIAEHQPPLRLASRTSDVARQAARRRIPLGADPPELYSPDASEAEKAQLRASRMQRAGLREAIACPLKGPSPFRPWRPGRAQLTLSSPAYSLDGAFAAVDAAVVLPGRRTDYYRVILSGPPKSAWDLHRIEFDSGR